jgi:hypothetical protein
MFTLERELDLVLDYKVTPNTTYSGKQLSFSLFYLSKIENNEWLQHIRQNRYCYPKNSGVKLQKHLNHIAGRAEPLRNGRIYFLRKAIRVEGKKYKFIIKQINLLFLSALKEARR